MMETRLIPKKFLKLIKNLADENRNYKKIFGNVFWLEVVKEKNYSWFNLRLNSNSLNKRESVVDELDKILGIKFDSRYVRIEDLKRYHSKILKSMYTTP